MDFLPVMWEKPRKENSRVLGEKYPSFKAPPILAFP